MNYLNYVLIHIISQIEAEAINDYVGIYLIQGKLSIDNNRGITVCNIIRGLIFDTEHQLENQHYNDWLKPKCLC